MRCSSCGSWASSSPELSSRGSETRDLWHFCSPPHFFPSSDPCWLSQWGAFTQHAAVQSVAKPMKSCRHPSRVVGRFPAPHNGGMGGSFLASLGRLCSRSQEGGGSMRLGAHVLAVRGGVTENVPPIPPFRRQCAQCGIGRRWREAPPSTPGRSRRPTTQGGPAVGRTCRAGRACTASRAVPSPSPRRSPRLGHGAPAPGGPGRGAQASSSHTLTKGAAKQWLSTSTR